MAIHLFANGNGRHARFIADLLLIAENTPKFSWGANLENELGKKEIRQQYIAALRSADKHHYKPLLEFLRQ